MIFAASHRIARLSNTTVFARLLDIATTYRQRVRLARLDDEALMDMGLTRAQALSEANRPFWDAPANWHV